PAMESCSGEWKKMKDAGTIPSGQTWPKFWSQCSKDYAAAHPDEAAGQQDTQTTPAPKKAGSTKAATADESNSSGSSEQKKQCDGRGPPKKSETAAQGWHDYFHFMAKCMKTVWPIGLGGLLKGPPVRQRDGVLESAGAPPS